MARTKQRHTYLPLTFPAVAGTHLPTLKRWRVK